MVPVLNVDEGAIIAHSPEMLGALQAAVLSPDVIVTLRGEISSHDLERPARMALALGLLMLRIEAQNQRDTAN